MHEKHPLPAKARRSWQPPQVTDLPPLRNLTLQSGGIEGGEGGFGFLDTSDPTRLLG